MNAPQKHGSGADAARSTAESHPKKPPQAVRRERLLDEIALQRIGLRQSAQTLTGPLRTIDRIRQGAGQRRQWLYPAAPVLALLAWRLRPRISSLPGLAARAFAVWRIVKHFR